MVISRTPVRISFLGGGTDYPAYFHRHGGATLAASIDKYTYITVSPLTEFFDHKIGIYYSRVELVRSIDEIQHPSVRECLRHLNIHNGIEIHIASDLPARTGLGSSSSFTVGLLKALYAFRGKMISHEQLAAEAVYVEQECIKERVGCQDQYACTYGGFHHFQFRKDKSIHVSALTVPHKRVQELEKGLMMFYTGVQRTAHDIIEEQLQRTSQGQIDNELAGLSSLVERGLAVLYGDGPLGAFGELLHEGWQLKRKCSAQTTNSSLDQLYDKARGAGAIGGKLLGAGGGGFFLFFVEPEKQAAVRQALSGFREVRFQFETSGSSIIVYRP